MTSFVLDASAAVVALVERSGRGRRVRQRLATATEMAVPAHFLVEAANALRGLERGGVIGADELRGALDDLRALPVTEYLVAGLLERAMDLRANATVYDALYLVLAEHLDCSVVTADAKLAAVPRTQCSVEVFA